MFARIELISKLSQRPFLAVDCLPYEISQRLLTGKQITKYYYRTVLIIAPFDHS